MTAKELIVVLKKEEENYFSWMEGCDEPEFSQYSKIIGKLRDLIGDLKELK